MQTGAESIMVKKRLIALSCYSLGFLLIFLVGGCGSKMDDGSEVISLSLKSEVKGVCTTRNYIDRLK